MEPGLGLASTRLLMSLSRENDKNQIDRIQALIKVDKGDKQTEELIAYETLLDYLEKNEAEENDPNLMWKFRAIKAHQGPILPTDPDYKGSRYNVQVEWDTEEITYETLSIISRDEPVTCSVYAKELGLLNEPG